MSESISTGREFTRREFTARSLGSLLTLSLLETYGCAADASALCTSSGMSAIKQALEPLVAMRERGESINFVS